MYGFEYYLINILVDIVIQRNKLIPTVFPSTTVKNQEE